MSNPYQIRTDVMSMAKEMLDKAYDTQMTLAYAVMNQYKENSEQALDAWDRYVPKMYTPEELKEQAEKLYEFVSKDGKTT
jgi:ferredoxin-NADP reductase